MFCILICDGKINFVSSPLKVQLIAIMIYNLMERLLLYLGIQMEYFCEEEKYGILEPCTEKWFLNVLASANKYDLGTESFKCYVVLKMMENLLCAA